ncbi:hypothetical protein WICPIJ_005207 [Wickerhamomyces pijperi]|uniref:Uncharacterized protein n=1 Tax=Wickerhamomyces pijperi TaxID=599730 RepID=A0A9P8Q406_WICPI|nr:hypothetical protein WICPIJ_005207 [Wickerhamomyces pijperi]
MSAIFHSETIRYIIFTKEGHPVPESYQSHFNGKYRSKTYVFELPNDMQVSMLPNYRLSKELTSSIGKLVDRLTRYPSSSQKIYVQFAFDMESKDTYQMMNFYPLIRPYLRGMDYHLELLKFSKGNGLLFTKSKDQLQTIFESISQKSVVFNHSEKSVVLDLDEQLFECQEDKLLRGLPYLQDSNVRKTALRLLDYHSKDVLSISVIVADWKPTADQLIESALTALEVADHMSADQFESCMQELWNSFFLELAKLEDINLSERSVGRLDEVLETIKDQAHYKLETQFWDKEGITEAFEDEGFSQEFDQFYELFYSFYTRGYKLTPTAENTAIKTSRLKGTGVNQTMRDARLVKTEQSLIKYINALLLEVNVQVPNFLEFRIYHSQGDISANFSGNIELNIRNSCFLKKMYSYYDYYRSLQNQAVWFEELKDFRISVLLKRNIAGQLFSQYEKVDSVIPERQAKRNALPIGPSKLRFSIEIMDQEEESWDM